MSLNESLAKVCKNLVLKEPFYGLYLMMLNKEWADDISTACVGKTGTNYRISINPGFWEGLSEDHRMGIAKHELLHIAFFHLFLQDMFPDNEVRALAMDMEINQYIDQNHLPSALITKEQFEEKYGKVIADLNEKLAAKTISQEQYKREMYKIPFKGIYIQDFPELKLDPKKGTKYYYDKLLEAHRSGKAPGLSDLINAMKAGNEMSPDGCVRLDDHGGWKEFKEMTDAERKLLQTQANYQLKEVAQEMMKGRGTIPGEIEDYIKGLFVVTPPKFDWKGYVRRFVGGSTKTFTKKTRRKSSKRFEENPGLKVKQRRRLLAVVDTSGSVSDEELHEFFNEIYHISKTGTEVTLLECDAGITYVGPFRKTERIAVHGRGGTSFDPPVDYFNANLRKFTCMVYLTDGEAPAPANKPKGSVLWVLSSKSKKTNHLPGQTIKLDL